MQKPTTFGELKQQVNQLPDVRTEMRQNLIRKLKTKESIFPEVIGYDETVLPALINAILCGHNIILLGIGEVDPIKVAQGRTLDDESSLHFGLVPRAHRSLFAINELPDLAEKIPVAFFNIMEKNDFQIKGFPVRLPGIHSQL